MQKHLLDEQEVKHIVTPEGVHLTIAKCVPRSALDGLAEKLEARLAALTRQSPATPAPVASLGGTDAASR